MQAFQIIFQSKSPEDDKPVSKLVKNVAPTSNDDSFLDAFSSMKVGGSQVNFFIFIFLI